MSAELWCLMCFGAFFIVVQACLQNTTDEALREAADLPFADDKLAAQPRRRY